MVFLGFLHQKPIFVDSFTKMDAVSRFGIQKSTKIDQKSIKKSIKKLNIFWMAFLINFWSILDSKSSQNRVQKGLAFGHFYLLGPRWPQDPFQAAPRIDFGSILDQFGLILVRLWILFRRCLEYFFIFVGINSIRQ